MINIIDIISIVEKVAGKLSLEKVKKFLEGNKEQIQSAYESAFQNAAQWYEGKYGDEYGTKNNRFFDYQVAEGELAKLLLLRPEPDIDLISDIQLSEGQTAPPEVVKGFVTRLREEMGMIRECEALLVEREQFTMLRDIERHTKGIELNTEFLPKIFNVLEEGLNLKEEKLGKGGNKPSHQIKPDPTPINWQELERMFREEYRLDRLDYGHLGTTRDSLEHKLELQKVYVALNVKDRSFDRIMQAAKVNKLTIQQQKNLPLLFQRFDDLLHLAHEKDQRAFYAKKETDDAQSYPIARKILEECNAGNIRSPKVIISEIMSSHRMKQDQVHRALWTLSSRAIVPRPLAEIPAKDRLFLIIGDAGGGKSTACRYMALRCFDNLKQGSPGCLEGEFGITNKTPLPVYMRLEDFGTMIADYADGDCCLFECAAKFWCRAGNYEVFTAGQLYHALHHQPVWLFLDGLDEISNPAYRRRLAAVLKDLASSEAFPQLRLTLTSRPAAITDELLNELGIPYYPLLNLEQDQIKDFAHKYFAANLVDETAGHVKKRAKELIDALDEVPAAKRLATNPLLLTVIAVLHYKEDKLPHYRAELYAKCIEQLMAQKAATMGKLETGKISFIYPPGSGKPTIAWNHNQIIDMLRDLAFHAHQRIEDEVFLNRELMLRRLKESDLIPTEKKTSHELEEAAAYFLDECDRLIGLLAFRGGHYVFIHRTFQEYLAAHWLSLQKEADQQAQLLSMLNNPSHWQEVIRLFFNRLGKSNPKFGEELVEQIGRQAAEHRDTLLIRLSAESLNDFEEYQQRYRLHDTIKSNLRNLRDTTHQQPSIFLACGDALGLMNEPAIDVVDPPVVFCGPDQPFTMGSEEYDNEKPVRPVQLSPYWIAKYTVTNKEFAEFIRSGGYADERYWFDKGGRFRFDGRGFLKGLKEKLPDYWLNEKFGRNRPLAPVAGVSWYEAMAYCRWWTLTFGRHWADLHQQHQEIARLPTEAEWEYACRAGTTTPFNTGDNLTTEQANYDGNYPYKNYPKGKYLEKTTSVGSYPPNALELYDMHGNVWEWCMDWYGEKYYDECQRQGIVENPEGPKSGSRRVLRIGVWYDFAQYCRSADRYNASPVYRYDSFGFRLVFVP